MEITAATIFLWFIAYSFLGWFCETIFCSIAERKIVNRGFLNGPICPIYGFGALLIIFCLHKMLNANILVLFLACAILTSILEYVTSWIMEKLFQARWWDYSHHLFQINGRICLSRTLTFGLMAVILLKVIQPIVVNLTSLIPIFYQNLAATILLLLLLFDFWITIKTTLSLNFKLKVIQNFINQEKSKYEQSLMDLKNNFQGYSQELSQIILEKKDWLKSQLESGEFYSEQISNLFKQNKYIEKRLFKAFPRLESLHNNEALNNLKAKVQNPKLLLKKHKK